MAIVISVSTDLDRLSASLNDFARNQLPFACARALTAVARDVAKAQTEALDTELSRPTPFTKRAFGITAARKSNLQAEVFAKDIQGKYLALAETGGVRTPARKALVMPAGVRLNQFGNIPRGALRRAQATGRVFVGNINGTNGIWQRMKRGHVKLLASFQPRATYRPQLGYRARLPGLVQRGFAQHLGEALEQALRTARR